jgi:ketoreductase RED2
MPARVVLVTGSTSGIGEATALAFAALGEHVVFNSVHSVDAGIRLSDATPGSCYLQADISKSEDCTRLIAEVLARYGRLDVLVNNAGITKRIAHQDLAAADLEVWREIFEVNVFGTWNLCVTAMDALRATSGAIVNVSSIAATTSGGSSIPYSASKAALNHMTALLAKAVGPDVRVNAVAPGLVATPWTAEWHDTHKLVGAIAPLRRSGLPEDIAQIIVDLALATYVTGQVVVIDGGLSI